MTKLTSDAQYGYIRRLAEERASQFPFGVEEFIKALKQNRLTMTGGSGLIDRLQRTPLDAVAGQPARDASRRTNMYAGTCVLCGHEVAAKAGYLAGSPGNWKAEHLPGECKSKDEPVTSKHEITEIVGDLPDGRYGIPAFTTNTESDTIFVEIYTNQGLYRPERKGQRGVKLIAGGGNEHVVSADWIAKAVHAIRSLGVTESMQLYGHRMGICGNCFKDLSVTLSKVTGFGPKCREKLGYIVSEEERTEARRIIAEAAARGEVLV